MSKIKKFLQRPWVQGTGIAILGVFGVRLIDYITGSHILNVLFKAIKALGQLLATRYEVSLWFLIILPIAVIGVILLVFLIIAGFQRNVNKPEVQQPPFINYKEDVFGAMSYRWEYSILAGKKFAIEELRHYCPTCKCRIVSNECPVCKKYFNYDVYRDDKVIALISHKIENNLY